MFVRVDSRDRDWSHQRIGDVPIERVVVLAVLPVILKPQRGSCVSLSDQDQSWRRSRNWKSLSAYTVAGAALFEAGGVARLRDSCQRQQRELRNESENA